MTIDNDTLMSPLTALVPNKWELLLLLYSIILVPLEKIPGLLSLSLTLHARTGVAAS